MLCAALLALIAMPVLALPIYPTVDEDGVVGLYTSLELNSSGLPVVSYWDNSHGNLKVMTCMDASCENRVFGIADEGFHSGDAVDGIVGLYTSLALKSNGNPVVSHYDLTREDLRLVICGNPFCTLGNTVIRSVDPLKGLTPSPNLGQYSSIALNASDNPVISHYDATNGNLRIIFCNNATCSSRTSKAVDDSANDVGQYGSLAINSSGFPVISYYDNTTKDLKLLTCGQTDCFTPGITIVTVDSVGDVGKYTSLAFDPDSGFPVISYYDATNGNAKLAICSNASCSSKTLVTLFEKTGVGSGVDTSIAFTPEGHPAVSHYEYTDTRLYLSVCKSAFCSDKITAILDGGGDVGRYSSLAYNPTGLPIISYYDVTNADLKLATIHPPTVTGTSLQALFDDGPVSFTVTFSENVYNPVGDTNGQDVTNPHNYVLVNAGANSLFDTPSCGEDIAGDDSQVEVSSASYTNPTVTVTLSTPLPPGKYRLYVCGRNNIHSNNRVMKLAGDGITPGTDYALDFITFKSNAKQDGWVLESSETSGVGGTLNKGAKTFNLGDDAANRQYRAILSFNTSGLPDDAVITKVTLKVKRAGTPVGGGNPINTFKGFMVDVKKGNFGKAPLQLADFQTKGNKTIGALKPKLVGGWYTLNLTKTKAKINLTGNTQIRLRFKLDDNNDSIANFLSLYSGNAGAANRPQLIVEYYVP
jgi:hypothetical protein